MKEWSSNKALYIGIELSWNMKIQQAKTIFKHFEKQKINEK